MIPLLLLAAVMIGYGIWFRATTPLPEMDLSKVDAAVRKTIERHVADVSKSPRSGEAWGWLGATLRTYHFDDASDLCLIEAERLDSTNPRWPHFRSRLWHSENPPLALSEAQRASELARNNPPLLRYRYAKLLAEDGQWNEAREVLLALTSAQPGYTPALLLLAHATLTADDSAQAALFAERCTSDPTTRRAAFVLLAQTYLRQGDHQKATLASQQAASLPEDNSPRDLYHEELSLRQGDPRQMSIVCHSLLANKQLDRASEIIDELVAQHPDLAETWLLHGRLLLLRKKPVEAETSLRRNLALELDSTQGLFQLGTSLLRQNKLQEAATVFTQATQIKPDFGPAWFNRGLILGRMGQLRAALASFEETVRHNPEHMDSYFFMTDLHLRLDEPEKAEQRLSEAAQLNPDDPRLEVFRKRLAER